ncbi:MAG: RCC1 repeat-containing protein [Nitrospinae bacterium]|nr:RCC1 repeat-containing protein [Nitrospinota bacterium]
MSWTGAPTATSYNVYMSTNPNNAAVVPTSYAWGTVACCTPGTVSFSGSTPAYVTLSPGSTILYDGTMPGTIKITGALTGMQIRGLTNGVTYYFVVSAVIGGGESASSAVVGATPQVPAPATPASFKVVAGNGAVTLSWQPVLYTVGGTNATGVTYSIYYSQYASSANVSSPNNVTGITSTGATLMTSGGTITGTGWTLSGTGVNIGSAPFVNGTTYYFVVTATNAGGEGAATGAVSALPKGVSFAVAGGEFHSASLGSDGTIWAWGNDSNGQLGDGQTLSRSSLAQVGKALSNSAFNSTKSTAVSCGGAHTVALTASGTAWAWGSNGFGQIGDGTNTDKLSPVQVQNTSDPSGYLTNVVAVSAGYQHTLALTASGTVWAWGSNASGQIGDGTTTTRYAPVQVTGLSGIIAISAGYQHSLALTSTGAVVAWGSNSNGQIGDGTTTNRYAPVQIGVVTNVIAITAGYQHSLAIKSDGSLYAWGNNSNGQLGDNTTTQRLSPVQVTDPSDSTGFITGVASVAAGFHHSVALKKTGAVWAWGSNFNGQIGDGTSTDRWVPAKATGLSGAVSVSAGYYNTMALQGNSFSSNSPGTVWGWGYNSYGQIGDASLTQRLSPVQASGFVFAPADSPSGLLAVAAAGPNVTLSWTGSSLATAYNVYYSTTPGGSNNSSKNKVTGMTSTGTTLATAGATITSTGTGGTVGASSKAFVSGTTYFFVVTASNASGESIGSAITTVTP